jgi:hypothetical protein
LELKETHALLYPFGRIVHAAFAGVPPVEPFVVVQSGPPELKFSERRVGGRGTDTLVEFEDKSVLLPSQIVAGDALTVTIGAGITTMTTLYVIGLVQPLAASVNTYVTGVFPALVLVSNSLIFPDPDPGDPELIPTIEARVQL